MTLDLTLKRGVVAKSEGQVRATDVAVGAPSWLGPMQASGRSLKLDYLAGEWKYLRRPEVSQLQIEQLVLSREQQDSPLPAFTVELSAGRLHSAIESAPLQSLATVARWLAPELAPDSVALEGTVEKLEWRLESAAARRLSAGRECKDRGDARHLRHARLRAERTAGAAAGDREPSRASRSMRPSRATEARCRS